MIERTDDRTAPLANGRVLRVNVSAGGVPKHPVADARVGPLGLVGDRHKADTGHGGPHRAVALLAIEAIQRVAAEGHPIEPGSVGENLTTQGIEWSLLPTGTRIEIGAQVVLELSTSANPCDTIVGSFSDGHSGRISILRHPSDSRMYARVLAEGTVRPGDEIRVLPPAADSMAETHRLLDLLDSVERQSYVTLWSALGATGRRIDTLVAYDLAVAACPGIPSLAFNRALGHRQLPNLLDRMLDVYRAAGTTGWIVAAPGPSGAAPWVGAASWTGAIPTDGGSDIFHAPLADYVAPPAAPGVTVRIVGPESVPQWADTFIAGYELTEPEATAWRELAPHLASAPGEHLLIAERDGRAVGAAALFTRRKVGLLAAAAVLPIERGRGVQRALIAARVEIARATGCDRLMATAAPEGPSERNLVAVGLSRLWQRRLWRFDPAPDEVAAAEPVGAARG
jgi:MOSC domain-containing protein YiiM/GNAT superfamily N-acetyltransferase